MSNFLQKVKSITSTDGVPSNVPYLHEADYLEDLEVITSRRSHQFTTESQYGNLNANYSVPEFLEDDITVVDFAKKMFNNPSDRIKNYLISLFPIAQWILHYNYRWLTGDLIAGITVGVVLVPQSMSYAQIAGLPAQFGLYSSFVGVFIYSFFATSKDVSIGPVAVMSAQVGKVIAHVQASAGEEVYKPEVIATVLSLVCGGIATAIGILRLGFILEFISSPAVLGFMSGSALNIISGQVPALMGFSSLVNTRQSTYLVIIDSLKNLKHSTSDAAFGLISLLILFVWKYGCEFGQKRWPRQKIWLFYFQQLRNAIVIIVATAIAWGLVHPKKVAWKGDPKKFKPPIKTIGEVPRGLQHVGVMSIPSGIIEHMAGEIPVSVVILLLEHIAIAKSFGRVNDYKIVPDQEVIAIGVNNLIGTFFNAYPATGSFSRSALKAKCGVRTPLAGIFTGAVVLLALYALTQTFYYIPKATLSAVIIHAVSDLIANYKVTFSFWNIAPFDCGIFIICVFITVFSSIENGIYFAVAASLALYLIRVAFPKGQFLGKVQIAEVVNPVISPVRLDSSTDSSEDDIEIHQVLSNGDNYQSTDKFKVKDSIRDTRISAQTLSRSNPHVRFHTKWVPLDIQNFNHDINIVPPPPGVIVFRPGDSFVYPNSSRQVDKVSDELKRLTRRGVDYDYSKTGSRPWNDPGPLRWNIPWSKNKNKDEKVKEDNRPLLKIIHFDFSNVSQIDVTSVQALVDLRNVANRYADREVEFHFSGIVSPWIRRALLKGGFGTYGDQGLVSENTYVNIGADHNDIESGIDTAYYAAIGTDTPFFHLEIPSY
jgi:sodium-independent sulfate anion transporter 11